MRITEQQLQEIIMKETELVLLESSVRSSVGRFAFNLFGIMRKTRAFMQLLEKAKGIKALDAAIESMKVGKYTDAARTIEDLVELGKLEPEYAEIFKDFINEAGAAAARQARTAEDIIEQVEIFKEIINAAQVLDFEDMAGVQALVKKVFEATKKLKAARAVGPEQIEEVVEALAEELPDVVEAIETTTRTGATMTVPVGGHWLSSSGTYFRMFSGLATIAAATGIIGTIYLVIKSKSGGGVEMSAAEQRGQRRAAGGARVPRPPAAPPAAAPSDKKPSTRGLE